MHVDEYREQLEARLAAAEDDSDRVREPLSVEPLRRTLNKFGSLGLATRTAGLLDELERVRPRDAGPRTDRVRDSQHTSGATVTGVQERVADGITAALAEEGELVVGWVAVVEVVGQEGKRALRTIPAPSQTPWNSRGYLTHAIARLERQASA